MEICEEGYEMNQNKTECVGKWMKNHQFYIQLIFSTVKIVYLNIVLIFFKDINECDSGTHNCPSLASCINTLSSFKCVCPTGYKLDQTRNICEDIDECAYGKLNTKKVLITSKQSSNP